jgi:hypothetical protein
MGVATVPETLFVKEGKGIDRGYEVHFWLTGLLCLHALHNDLLFVRLDQHEWNTQT